MENASKALIIAGAILISILLISVGILIMNSTNNVTDQVQGQGESLAIQSFNSQFTAYEGKGKSASQVKALLNVIRSSNATNSKQLPLPTVTPENTKRYKITIEGYDTEGYINSITVEEQR